MSHVKNSFVLVYSENSLVHKAVKIRASLGDDQLTNELTFWKKKIDINFTVD